MHIIGMVCRWVETPAARLSYGSCAFRLEIPGALSRRSASMLKHHNILTGSESVKPYPP